MQGNLASPATGLSPARGCVPLGTPTQKKSRCFQGCLRILLYKELFHLMNEKRIFGVLHVGMNHFRLAIATNKAHYDAYAFALRLALSAYRAPAITDVVHVHPRLLLRLSSIPIIMPRILLNYTCFITYFKYLYIVCGIRVNGERRELQSLGLIYPTIYRYML